MFSRKKQTLGVCVITPEQLFHVCVYSRRESMACVLKSINSRSISSSRLISSSRSIRLVTSRSSKVWSTDKLSSSSKFITNQRRMMSLSNDEIVRYGRQLILDEIGKDGQLKLKSSSVLIVGCGGLGCPSSMYLAAAGVGKSSKVCTN